MNTNRTFKALGTVMDEFSEKGFKVVLEFVKFIDSYENYGKNGRINKLKVKKEKNTLTSNEEYELNELLPINLETLDTNG
ncbi:hypothetical protein [Metabacillus sp. B2-18]|uniref:hypothetical protein n=1 Tax=Metabacillus sp. B2-18 TaxID=2897333 RepID=UPI001E4C0A47|nr:hypothetical protein [Metabacillus sp. B2-18]UGB28802.1 hypothetical protein LPC09_13455 [Metabacillus sp. B2-18]